MTQKLGAALYIMDVWARFRRQLLKDGYTDLKFFWVKEFTENGERHLHVLVNAYIPWEYIRSTWEKLTLGESYIVWITGKDIEGREGDIWNAAGYATKYLTKALAGEARFDKGERRFGFSRSPGFKSVPVLYGDFWEIIADPSPWIVHAGYGLVDWSADHIIQSSRRKRISGEPLTGMSETARRRRLSHEPPATVATTSP